jgi:hypothetical protein
VSCSGDDLRDYAGALPKISLSIQKL